MYKKVKFVSITRTIDPKSGIQYLDAIDNKGIHWMAEMSRENLLGHWNGQKSTQVFTVMWKKDPQQPIKDLN